MSRPEAGTENLIVMSFYGYRGEDIKISAETRHKFGRVGR